MEPAVPRKEMGGTKCAVARGCEDGNEISTAKLPVLRNKTVRRE